MRNSRWSLLLSIGIGIIGIEIPVACIIAVASPVEERMAGRAVSTIITVSSERSYHFSFAGITEIRSHEQSPNIVFRINLLVGTVYILVDHFVSFIRHGVGFKISAIIGSDCKEVEIHHVEIVEGGTARLMKQHTKLTLH